MKKPVIFYSGNTVVKGGNAVCIRGEYLDTLKKAVITDGVNRADIQVYQLNRQSFKFIIPENFNEGVYRLCLEFEGDDLEIDLNAPVVRWVHCDEGAMATVGGWIRFTGEAIRVGGGEPFAELTCKKCGTVFTLTDAYIYDDYSVEFKVPELPEGEYTVKYSNGYLTDKVEHMVTVGKPVRSTWRDVVYNVMDHGFTLEPDENNSPAFKALLEKVSAEGGGVIYFPRGRFRLEEVFTIPENVVIRGAGITKTSIFWPDMWGTERLCEDGQHRWYPTPLPECMITAGSNFAIENLDITMARSGAFIKIGSEEKPAKNVYLKDLRIYGNMLSGSKLHSRFGADNFAARIEVIRESIMNKTDLFVVNGENIQIKDCNVLWSGRPFCERNNTKYFHLKNVVFGCATAVDNWAPMGKLVNALIEDNEFHRWTSGFGGYSIYYSRNKIIDTVDNDRESFTTDCELGINYFGPVEIDGVIVKIPERIDMKYAKVGGVVCILSGTGAGQFRYITALDGHTVTIESPFEVDPDETSHVTVNAMHTNWYFVNNYLHNCGSLQFYVAQRNSVVDGTEISRSKGIRAWGHHVYGGIGNSWYTSYVNNKLSDGNYYHMEGDIIGNAGISSTISVHGVIKETVNMCTTVRGNITRENTMISIDGGEAFPAISDVVIDGNFASDTPCGIFLKGLQERAFICNNKTEDVPTPVRIAKEANKENVLILN